MKKVLSVLVLLLLVSACSPKEQARWSASTKISLGVLPADVCRVDGVPQIIGVNMDEGDMSLVYVRKNGDIVMAHYLKSPILGTEFNKGGEFYWTGGNCPQ